MDVQSVFEQLYFATAHVVGRAEDSSSTGTGFFYTVETDQGTALLLVTNRHVIADASDLTIQMMRARDGDHDQPMLGSAIRVHFALSDVKWTGHPDAEVDVAVVSLNKALSKVAEPLFYRSVSPEICLERDGFHALDVFEQVTFIGYPGGLFDSVNLLPIARRGTTATPLSVDYKGWPAFLIDASVFPGSSGSPVFLIDRGMYWDKRRNATIVGGRISCLGVLAAFHSHQVEGEVHELPAHSIVQFSQPLDLGLVFKAWTIDECVDALLATEGVTRLRGEDTGEAPVATAGE